MALVNQTMFLKFMLFNQDMFRMNHHPSSVVQPHRQLYTSVFHKKTYTGLLTNYFSFVPFSYKLGLVRTLVDRIFKINNTWAGFHLDINNLTKNSFPSSVIENVVRKFLNNYFTPIPLRMLLVRTIVCILNYRTSVLFPS